jgi:hypothetical protein
MPLEVYYRVSDGTDANDKPWEIGVMGTDILVRTNGSLRLDRKRREHFQRTFMEAERQAEGSG